MKNKIMSNTGGKKNIKDKTVILNKVSLKNAPLNVQKSYKNIDNMIFIEL